MSTMPNFRSAEEFEAGFEAEVARLVAEGYPERVARMQTALAWKLVTGDAEPVDADGAPAGQDPRIKAWLADLSRKRNR